MGQKEKVSQNIHDIIILLKRVVIKYEKHALKISSIFCANPLCKISLRRFLQWKSKKTLEIDNQAKQKNISASKYCNEIGINPQNYYQVKLLLKIKDRNKINKVQNEEPVIENKSLFITFNGFSIRIEEYSINQLVDISRTIINA